MKAVYMIISSSRNLLQLSTTKKNILLPFITSRSIASTTTTTATTTTTTNNTTKETANKVTAGTLERFISSEINNVSLVQQMKVNGFDGQPCKVTIPRKWDENVASISEAIVKAERHPLSFEEMQARSIKAIKKKEALWGANGPTDPSGM